MLYLKVIGWLVLIGLITIAFRSRPSVVIPWFIAFTFVVYACLNFIDKHEPW